MAGQAGASPLSRAWLGQQIGWVQLKLEWVWLLLEAVLGSFPDERLTRLRVSEVCALASGRPGSTPPHHPQTEGNR